MPRRQSRRHRAAINTLSTNQITAESLRADTAYGQGRSIVLAIACFNGIIQPLGLWFILDRHAFFIQVIACVSALFFWVFFEQVGRAFFDIADSNLVQARRNQDADS